MATRLYNCVAVCCGLLAVMAKPASGQIAIYVNDHGKRVYVNAEPPAPRRTAPARSSAKTAAPQAATVRSSPVAAARSRQLSKTELERIVHETAARHRVDPALVRAVIEAESGWKPNAVSRKGAQGLMQLVPGTAEKLGVSDTFDPAQNVDGGVKYLRMLLERYNGDMDKALAAYNAGPGAVDRARGVPNYPETRAYVQKVTDTYFRPGSGRATQVMGTSRPIYRIVDERGRVVYVNE
ncbi:MAG: lytic transglycosylase domain-containing protein [Acidobacteria bacterium]|nr:lytic transglycosylase domain-containing protein [Acidobacteriota bacterium]MBI3663673.1 lytic transglycosylase domain-containing protein [Acidobacteriota bacterium]